MTESWSVDGFDGKLQLVSVDEIKHVFALESQSMYCWFNMYLLVSIMFVHQFVRVS